ncbi:hypothetical protein A6R68_10991, partial [Neotoma lepida]
TGRGGGDAEQAAGSASRSSQRQGRSASGGSPAAAAGGSRGGGGRRGAFPPARPGGAPGPALVRQSPGPPAAGGPAQGRPETLGLSGHGAARSGSLGPARSARSREGPGHPTIQGPGSRPGCSPAPCLQES